MGAGAQGRRARLNAVADRLLLGALRDAGDRIVEKGSAAASAWRGNFRAMVTTPSYWSAAGLAARMRLAVCVRLRTTKPNGKTRVVPETLPRAATSPSVKT